MGLAKGDRLCQYGYTLKGPCECECCVVCVHELEWLSVDAYYLSDMRGRTLVYQSRTVASCRDEEEEA